MDVHELRRAFVLTEAVGDKIRDFRMERVARIAAGETPVPLIHQDRFKLILHVIPYSSFAISQVLDLKTCTQSARKYLQPTTLVRFNLDGLVTYLNVQDNLAGWYYQIFHHGQIEYVSVDMPFQTKGDVLLPSQAIEDTIIDESWSCLQFLQEIKVEPPLFIFLSLVGVKDTRLATEKYPIYFNNAKFDRDPVLIPEVLLETYPSTKEEMPQILKPLRDAMWNASGFDQSPY